MNKRGQIYILAAVILSLAIFSVMKVTNKFVAPSEDNFDFFVENFEGERSYVMNLGLLEDQEVVYYLKGTAYEHGILQIFQDFGINTGIVLVEYSEGDGGWIVTNFLGDEITTDCDDCDSFVIPSEQNPLADVSFSITKGEKRWNVPGDWDPNKDYNSYVLGVKDSITIKINENDYKFDKPLGGGNRVESIVFRNIDKNYVRVVSI